MKLIFHGGAREVGKSCIELAVGQDRYVLDAGIKFKEDGFEAPFELFDLPEIDGLFLSHAHLDHTGALPLFEHHNLICPLFTTAQTKELTAILLKDSYKIARIKHLHPAYQKADLKKVYGASRIVEFGKEYTYRNLKFKFLNAGHIPGSAMILIKTEGKKLLYTGDFKLRSTQLMKGAETTLDTALADDFKDIDIMITESTYGDKIMPERGPLEAQFLDAIEEVVKKGSVLIPVFALGRAQDILLVLTQRKWQVPIYLDGMCVTITKSILGENPAFLNKRAQLHDIFTKKTIAVTKESQRTKAMEHRGIFITTSGMLQGGPVVKYLEDMWGEPNNAIFLTGYQCKRTNGRTLVENGYIYLNGWKTYIKCQVRKFDFSGHSDDSELKEFITKVNPKNIIFQHGDNEAIDNLAAWADKAIMSKVYTPKVGDSIEFK